MSPLDRSRALVMAAAVLLAGCLPPPTYTYEELDANDDTSLDREELAGWLDHQEVFTAWDRNDDAALDPREVGAGLFELWDVDDDGVLSGDEWSGGVEWWYSGDAVYETHRTWDRDGDLEIDAVEAEEGVTATRLLELWDLDGDDRVEREELEWALFDTWDLNEDGVLDADEWESGYAWWRDA